MRNAKPRPDQGRQRAAEVAELKNIPSTRLVFESFHLTPGKAMKDDTSQLSKLGSEKTSYQFTGPNVSILETFPNQQPDRNYKIQHYTEEFTSLCPKTGQPDFASIDIQYVANEKCVETKSLKLYLFAFRNEGTFMETIVNKILSDLVATTQPRAMKIIGAFGARGGIATTVEATYEKE